MKCRILFSRKNAILSSAELAQRVVKGHSSDFIISPYHILSLRGVICLCPPGLDTCIKSWNKNKASLQTTFKLHLITTDTIFSFNNLYHSLADFSRQQIGGIFFFFPEISISIFNANSHFCGKNKKKNISKCRQKKILPRKRSVKFPY